MTARPMPDGIIKTAAMMGPSFSIATENRSTASRAPVFSSELMSIRQRIQTNARRVRVMADMSEPFERRVRARVTADQADEQLFERAPGAAAAAPLVDRRLRP